MELEQAEADYERALQHRADQHRYIAEAQRELAARRSILPSLDHEVARARARLDAARGETPNYPSRADQVSAQREVEMTQHAARHPAHALADPDWPHRYSGNIFGDECWVGQLTDAGPCGFRPGPDGITDEAHVRP